MKIDTDYPADSVEFCPAQGYQNILACGTYRLVEEPDGESSQNCHRKRLGKCILYKVLPAQDDSKL